MEFQFYSSDVNKHSAAHVLAAAVKRLFPNLKVGIGPVTRTGFFYDFDLDKNIGKEDLEKMQEEVDKIIEEDLTFQQVWMNKETAMNALMQAGQVYKLELLKQIPDEQVSFYKLGSDFTDLCRGPHVYRTSEIGIIKLEGIKLVHWLDDPSKSQLTRISGMVFKDKGEFSEYEEFLEKSKDTDFISRGSRNNLLYTVGKGETGKLTLMQKGSSVISSISRSIESELVKNVPFASIIDTAPSSSLKDCRELINGTFKHRIPSYKELPTILKLSTIKTDTVYDFHAAALVDFFSIYFDNAHNHMVTNSFVENVIEIAKKLTKEEVKVDIETADLGIKLVDSFGTYLTKSIVSHNKVLVKDTVGMIDLNFRAQKDNVNETIFKLSYFDTNEGIKVRNEKNELTEVSSILVRINYLNILKFQVESFDRDFPFFLKPIQIIFIPQNKSLNQEVVNFVESIDAFKNFRTQMDLTSKSLKEKIYTAEKNKIDFICVIGEKELKNRAVSLRQKNQQIGLLNLETFFELITNKED